LLHKSIQEAQQIGEKQGCLDLAEALADLSFHSMLLVSGYVCMKLHQSIEALQGRRNDMTNWGSEVEFHHSNPMAV
jgi:hypothetical protein